MSSSGQTTTNSNTLLFRSNPSVPGVNNIYALDKYNKPLPPGQVFVTSTNGIMNQETYYDGLKWSNYPAIHDVNMAGYNINNVSSISTSNFTTNSLNINVPSQTIQFTNESSTYVIEEGVTEIYFEMIGAGGTSVTDDPNSGRGGNGGYMSGTILVNSNNLSGQTLSIGAGKRGTNSSSASYISINNSEANDVIIAIAGSGGNGGSVVTSTPTYQAEGGCGGGQQFNPLGDSNAGYVSQGGNGTTNTGQSTVTGGGGGGKVTGGAGGTGTFNGHNGLNPSGFLPVLGGLGAFVELANAGAGGGGYSGGGGGGISEDGTISSGGGGGSSYYAGTYVNNVSSNDGNHLSPGTLPSNGRADQDGIVILTIYKQTAIATSGDIDCSGTIICNVLKYNVLDPPLYVSPQNAWSNFPAEGNINISNYNINNVNVANISTINLRGGQYLFETIADNAPRPSLTSSLNNYEIRAVSVNDADIKNGKAGFLQLTAGGDTDTTNMTYMQLSGYSSVPDMNNNIVFGTAGSEKVRITSTGNVIIYSTLTVNDNVNITNLLSTNNATINNTLTVIGQLDAGNIQMYSGFIHAVSTIDMNNGVITGANNISTNNATVSDTLTVIGQLDAGNIQMYSGFIHSVSTIDMNNGVITGANTINTNYATINSTLTVTDIINTSTINCSTLNYNTLSPNVVTGVIPGHGITITSGSQIGAKYVGDITITATPDVYQEEYMFISTNTTIQYSDISQYTFLDYLIVGGGGGGGAAIGGGVGNSNYGGGGGGSGYIKSSFYNSYKKLENNNFKYTFYQTDNNTIDLTTYANNITITIGQGGVGGNIGTVIGGTGGTTILSISSISISVSGGEGGQPYGIELCRGGNGFNGGGGGSGVGTSIAGVGGITLKGNIDMINYGGSNGYNAPNSQLSGNGGGLGAGIGQFSGAALDANAGGGGGAGSCVTIINGTKTGGNGSINGVSPGPDINGVNGTGAGGGGGSLLTTYINGGNGGSGYAILWFHT